MKLKPNHGRIPFALLAVFLSAGSARAEVVERIVAVVDKEIILLSELNERLGPFMAQIARMPASQRKLQEQKLRRQALKQMVDQKLLASEARRLKIRVTERDLDRAIADVMRKNNLTKEQLAAALKQEGKDLQAYRNVMLRPQLLRFKVLNVHVRPKITVSADEIKARYNKNLRALGVQEKVRARHIFVAIPTNASATVLAAKRKRAIELLALVKAQGADFAALAKKHSEDSVTRGSGGDLGFFARGTLPAAIEDVVFSAKKGDIRGPLRTPRGFHLIQLVEKRASAARPFKDVKQQLRGQILGEKMEKATLAWLGELRKKSHVDVRL